MTMPFHRFKHAYRSIGIGKPDAWCTTEFYGWLGSGVKDKNSVEIYEGDRVKIFDIQDEIFTVKFRDGVFVVSEFYLVDITAHDIEVVGHITEDES